MKTARIKDNNGVIHNYNPLNIKDVQEIENTLNNEWCINIILTGEGEHINSILCHSKEEMETIRDMILESLNSINI